MVVLVVVFLWWLRFFLTGRSRRAKAEAFLYIFDICMMVILILDGYSIFFYQF